MSSLIAQAILGIIFRILVLILCVLGIYAIVLLIKALKIYIKKNS
ncbi:hypothetical protein [Clostridium sp. YIM B02500]|nr:hypothetical protein [Clostridium sp. YIM B02500]